MTPEQKAICDYYGPDRQGRPYGYPWSGYTKGYHRGLDLRKRNASKTASVVTDVVSLSAGRVERIYFTKLLGWTIVIDTGRRVGRYEAHSHCFAAIVGRNDEVRAGQVLARNADPNREAAGLIDGPHDHFTIGDYPDVADNTSRGEYDPMIFINAALAEIDKPKEWDEMATQAEVAAAVRGEVERATRAEIDKLAKEIPSISPSSVRIVTARGPSTKPGPHVFLTGPGGKKYIPSPEHLALLRRWVLSTPSKEALFTERELDIITSYLRDLK